MNEIKISLFPFYDYLINPSIVLGRHPFWANLKIPYFETKIDNRISDITNSSINYDVCLKNYNINNKRQILRNMVNPEIGKYILERALEKPIKLNGLFEFTS